MIRQKAKIEGRIVSKCHLHYSIVGKTSLFKSPMTAKSIISEHLFHMKRFRTLFSQKQKRKDLIKGRRDIRFCTTKLFVKLVVQCKVKNSYNTYFFLLVTIRTK